MLFRTVNKGRLLPALFLCLAGCVSIPDSARMMPHGYPAFELVETPFHPQERYQCGPAALTTILQAAGAEVSLDEIVAKVYLPGRRGSLQLEMIAATRTSGLLPYQVDRSMTALMNELYNGRPVVVLQNLGVAAIPRWHYAVVIGLDNVNDRVILRSGTDRRRETPINVFLRTWARSDFWGMVALPPGKLPADVDRDRYFESVVGLEQAGMPAQAEVAWSAAVEKWPGNTTALFGLGNARLALDNYSGAETAYRQLLAINGSITVARNNLAHVLTRQRRLHEALEEIRMAIRQNDDPALDPALQETLAEVERRISLQDDPGNESI